MFIQTYWTDVTEKSTGLNSKENGAHGACEEGENEQRYSPQIEATGHRSRVHPEKMASDS